MQPVGYITDAAGQRVFALVPVAQVKSNTARGAVPPGDPSEDEQAALVEFLTRPMACLETSIQLNPIRSVREAAGITQADLAFTLRISQPMLSRQERPFRAVRSGTIKRALEAILCIQENRNRPRVSLEAVLAEYGARLAAGAARKPRDPVERLLLREMGDPVALGESEANVREGGERRRPPRKKAK